MKLGGQVAVVTGAGRGIGRAIAVSLAREGAAVALAARTGSELEAVAKEIREIGGRCLAVSTDVTQADQVGRLFDRAERELGPVDMLVSNAGVLEVGEVASLPEEAWSRTLAVNLTGPFLCAKRALSSMLPRRRGRIVHISSISAVLGTPRLSAYCASKWGLNGFTKSLAEEVRSSGVFVSAVMPGSVDTDMLKKAGFPPDMQPGDVAKVVLFLCAEAPMAMSGAAVEVFG